VDGTEFTSTGIALNRNLSSIQEKPNGATQKKKGRQKIQKIPNKIRTEGRKRRNTGRVDI
jgi:hypothetical protein